MKKKIFLSIVTIAFCSMIGCSDSKPTNLESKEEDTIVARVVEEPQSQDIMQADIETENINPSQNNNLLLNCTVATDDVMSGDRTNILGTYAYITVDKNTLKSVSEEDFSAFCDYVSDCSYNWFSIICEDGTGIVFSGCDINMPTYGEVDSDGAILKSYGFISKGSDGKYFFSTSSN